MIEDSTFRFAGTYRFVSARAVGHPEQHLMITRDAYETTVVTTEELLGDVEVLDINADRWLLLAIDCANPFYCVGFIAKISAALSGRRAQLVRERLLSTLTPISFSIRPAYPS